ncbi:A24 family peptidase [Brevibacillus humidisoli]|uniref:A24 family peptidase n=1 Tax=Brevibacillus humidisoli TaxID=2895522 RepID=UPI001E484011|nr:A24 family peptidase [Brevibacillus humidisoli]UFJ40582.1 A24 family peptidase [Brevibacillus humidisoli]
MTIPAVYLFGFLLVAACWDWRFRKVPNALLFPSMLLGISYQIWIGGGWRSAGGVGIAFVLSFLPVVLRSMGMGDQKLLMAVGAWTSGQVVYTLFLLSLLIGMCLLLCRPHRWRSLHDNLLRLSAGWLAHRQIWLPSHEQSAMALPYAVCLFLAFCLWSWEGAGWG